MVRPSQLLYPQREPAVLRNAATVLLLRDTATGMEVLMTRRSLTASFAPGAYVFPGGGIDAKRKQWKKLKGKYLFNLETTVGRTKKCAILFVATFTHRVNFEMPKFFNIFIDLTKLVSGQLRFLGLSLSCQIH